MIIDVATYTDGRREEVDDLAAALERCRRGERGFVWLGVHDPTAEEFEGVARVLHLHRLAVEEAVQGHQRPKVERFDDVTFAVLKALAYYEDRSAVETGEVMVFTAEHFVVTVRRGQLGDLGPVREALQADAHRLRLGPRAVLHAVMAHVVGGYRAVDEALEQDVEEMEEQVFSPARTSDAARIYSLKREVLEVRRAAAPLVAPVRALVERGEAPPGDGSAHELEHRVERGLAHG
ncbi:CorA family divalent cation transporter, partial [Kineococcus indalonis]|uniref:CorA family divalent cation transporter n=1 Tax=Kineococcus indalonis TaxID=2696566 RepID=UPI002B1BD7E5